MMLVFERGFLSLECVRDEVVDRGSSQGHKANHVFLY